MRRRRLTRNARLIEWEEGVATYLRRIGDGGEITAAWKDSIELPIDICADASHVGDPHAAIGRMVFPEIATMFSDEGYLLSGAVLATKNEDIDRINDAIKERRPG